MGRRTVTYDVDSRNDANYRFEQQQKNLGSQLGGVIFSKLDLLPARGMPEALLPSRAGNAVCRAIRCTIKSPPCPQLPSGVPTNPPPASAPAQVLSPLTHRGRPFPPSSHRAVCNSRTYHTCMEGLMFGLPAPHWCYVQHVRAG